MQSPHNSLTYNIKNQFQLSWQGYAEQQEKKLLTSFKKIILFCSYARQTSKKSIWELFMLDLMKPFVFIIFHLFSLCSTIYRTSEFVSRVIHHQYSLEMLFDLEVFFGQISRWIYLMSILCYYNPKIFIFSILNQYCFTCLWLMTSSGVDFWLEIYFALSYQISPKVNRNTRKVWRKTIKYSILNEWKNSNLKVIRGNLNAQQLSSDVLNYSNTRNHNMQSEQESEWVGKWRNPIWKWTIWWWRDPH